MTCTYVGDDARVGDRPGGSNVVAADVLPGHIGSSFVALGRVNRQNRHVTCLISGLVFRMKHRAAGG